MALVAGAPSAASAETTCASQYVDTSAGGCNVDYCIESTDSAFCTSNYYVVNGSTVSCGSCTDQATLQSCVNRAAQQCPTGTGGSSSSGSGSNSCQYAYDGECDEGSYCDSGTDSADCDSGAPSSGSGSSSGSNSCRYAFDGECDEGSYCDYGTDSGDCDSGAPSSSSSSGNDSCEYAFDGECDEGTYCDYGTDSGDCDSGAPSSGANSCRYAYDGECDEGSFCPYGTDSSDCDGGGGGCSAQPDPRAPGGSGSAPLGLAALLLWGMLTRRRAGRLPPR